MDTKLECEVDVEGAVDMMIRGEGIRKAPSISRRPSYNRRGRLSGTCHGRHCPSSSPDFPVCIYETV